MYLVPAATAIRLISSFAVGTEGAAAAAAEAAPASWMSAATSATSSASSALSMRLTTVASRRSSSIEIGSGDRERWEEV